MLCAYACAGARFLSEVSVSVHGIIVGGYLNDNRTIVAGNRQYALDNASASMGPIQLARLPSVEGDFDRSAHALWPVGSAIDDDRHEHHRRCHPHNHE